MKIDNHIPEKDKVEIVDQKQIKKQVAVIGTIRPYKGHKLFEVNLLTGDIKEAEFELQDADYLKALNGKENKRKKVMQKDGCMYISALNKKNAIIKLKKQFSNREKLYQ